ncbi:hypothetical protein ACCS37_15875 [Rhizobium ruizarguesonis]
MNAAAMLRNRAILEAINADRAPAMTDGGIVGKSSRGASGGNAFVMGDINVNVQSTGSSGDPAKDEQHNRGMAAGRSGDRSADDGVDSEQMRPGGLLYGRR